MQRICFSAMASLCIPLWRLSLFKEKKTFKTLFKLSVAWKRQKKKNDINIVRKIKEKETTTKKTGIYEQTAFTTGACNENIACIQIEVWLFCIPFSQCTSEDEIQQTAA